MSGETPLAIPDALMEQIFREARAAFPAECVGWLTGPEEAGAVDGVRPCVNAQEDGEHPTAADRGAETAYVIAGKDLLAFSRSFDSDQPARVIYHSHPNGRAYFSDTDRQVATSPWGDGPVYPVQQLVVGIDGERVTEAAMFSWSDEEQGFVEIARYPGAEI
jgi:proteasome lid subunit RPN8/RPN11